MRDYRARTQFVLAKVTWAAFSFFTRSSTNLAVFTLAVVRAVHIPAAVREIVSTVITTLTAFLTLISEAFKISAAVFFFFI